MAFPFSVSKCVGPATGEAGMSTNNTVSYCNNVILYNTVTFFFYLFMKTNNKLEKERLFRFLYCIKGHSNKIFDFHFFTSFEPA